MGASPDGVINNNRLIEIKCPITRNVEKQSAKNKITDICPDYYYEQIQAQLECCDMDICDFFQCKFSIID